jgi:hypothetical protein
MLIWRASKLGAKCIAACPQTPYPPQRVHSAVSYPLPYLKRVQILREAQDIKEQPMNVVVTISQSLQAARTACLNKRDCIEILCHLKLGGTATKTLSSVDDEQGCWCAESGIKLELHGVSKEDVCERLWPLLKQRFHLECAHVRLCNGHFSGCIFDWMRPSACPVSQRRAAARTDSSFSLISLA